LPKLLFLIFVSHLTNLFKYFPLFALKCPMTTKGLLHTSAQFPAILHIFPNFEFLIEDIIKLSGNLARFLWRIFQSLYRIFLNYSQFFNCWKHLPTFTLPLIRHGAGS